MAVESGFSERMLIMWLRLIYRLTGSCHGPMFDRDGYCLICYYSRGR